MTYEMISFTEIADKLQPLSLSFQNQLNLTTALQSFKDACLAQKQELDPDTQNAADDKKHKLALQVSAFINLIAVLNTEYFAINAASKNTLSIDAQTLKKVNHSLSAIFKAMGEFESTLLTTGDKLSLAGETLLHGISGFACGIMVALGVTFIAAATLPFSQTTLLILGFSVFCLSTLILACKHGYEGYQNEKLDIVKQHAEDKSYLRSSPVDQSKYIVSQGSIFAYKLHKEIVEQDKTITDNTSYLMQVLSCIPTSA